MPQPRFTQLDDWLQWLETLHTSEIDLGLVRIARVADDLGIPVKPSAHAATRVVTVAGTNGKGSFVKTAQTLLVAAGKHVGSYTSPHFLRYNERICIDGEPVSDARICDAFAAIDIARRDTTLTYFEFGTLAALKIFADSALDYWVLEVGLGGRLDAVNVIDADLAVITSIAVDHEAWLGSDREQIAIEKAGILRRDAMAICADDNPPRSLLKCLAVQAQSSLCLGRDYHCVETDSGVTFSGNGFAAFSCDVVNLPLPSVAAALQAVEFLGEIDTIFARLPEILPDLSLPGRFERLTYQGCPIILDVAHNPAAAIFLAGQLPQKSPGKKVILMALMADKDVSQTLVPLLPLANRWYCTEINNVPRCLPALALAKALRQQINAEVETSLVESEVSKKAHDNEVQVYARECFTQALEQAVVDAKKCGADVLIVGSFFTVAAAKIYFNLHRE